MYSKSLIISILILFSFSSCKKYEDGPTFSLRTKKGRVTNTWKIDELYIDGNKQNLSEMDKRSRITLRKDGTATALLVTDTSNYELDGSWEFENKKKEIELTGDFNMAGEFHSYNTEMTILRLKEKELWLEYEVVDPSTFQKEDYEAHYIPE